MPSKLMTPGVYIEEKNAFPNSAVAVETAVPAFIGYTDLAVRNGKSLVNMPTRITSFAEYVECFGGAFKPKYKISDPTPDIKQDTFMLNGKEKIVEVLEKNTSYMFNSIRLFYANGGGPCYIISVGTYHGKESLEIKASDFIGSDSNTNPPLKQLEKEFEPTLIVMPDAIALGTDSYSTIYAQVLAHCAGQQNRFGVFDLVRQLPSEITNDIAKTFREGIGMNNLNYGAAYYPWLKTSVVQPAEINFENLDNWKGLDDTLPEPKAKEAVVAFKAKTSYTATLDLLTELIKNNAKTVVAATAAETAEADATKKAPLTKLKEKYEGINTKATAAKVLLEAANVEEAEKDLATAPTDAAKVTALNDAKDKWEKGMKDAEIALEPVSPKFADNAARYFESLKLNFHQSLKASSATYVNIMEEIRTQINELPPSGAMVGIYTAVDNSRGVWKSPANVSVNMVNAPSVNINHEGQETLNVDVMAGKSINVIRAFPGIGCLVWGGRTLDGNSQDWRYINVRRTMIMIEQSLKLATRAYVFEPNDANTWITVKSMFSNFLTNLWKQGALAGSAPEQAFDVQVGLGATMTANDILDGKMLITVKVAIVRPAEFIVITFQQQMQQS